MNVRRGRLVSAAAALVVSCAGVAFGQSAPIPIRHVALRVDSGVVAAGAGQANPGVAVPVFSKLVSVPNAQWLRLKFDQAILAGDPEQGTGSYIMITGAGGAFQTMDARHLADWSYSSAVFNGDSVLVEIYAFPGTGNNRLSMTTIMASEPGPGGMGFVDTICGAQDNRVLSSDPRQGRLWPVGCTAWLITNGNCANRFLTAGHCITAGAVGQIVQFNVPLSTAGGTAVAPPPQDQFPVIPASIQSTGDVGVGIDAAQFFTGPNSTTSLQARVHMGGAAYSLAGAAPGGTGQTIRVTGYGLTDPNDPPGGGLPLNQSLVQKTHTGPYSGLSGTNIRYAVDTTGGNSGSPVVTEADGLAIGIHTHAGCSGAAGSFNNGTAIQFATLQNYLANPLGPCTPMPSGVTPKGGPFAEGGVADHFNRADGPIGSDWSGTPLANFTISGNKGTHAGAASEFIQNDAFTGDHRSGVQWINAFTNGTSLQYVAVVGGMGGTGYFYVKVQAQTATGKFSHIGFYSNANGPWPGGAPFGALSSEFDQGRLRVSVSPDGDTVTADIDTNFDGIPDQTYQSSGLNGIAGTFGKKFGIGAFGSPTYDNWNATHDGNTDGFNRADGPMTGPWAGSSGTFANFSISGNAGAHTSAVIGDVMRYTGAGGSGVYTSKAQWVDVIVNGTTLQYVGLAAGLGGADYIFVKAQAQTATGKISHLGFYNSAASAWPGMTGGAGFFAVSSEFAAARVRLSVSSDGDLATYDVDTDFDGVPDQSYARGGLGGISLGTGFGLTAYGPAKYDNYALLNMAGDNFNRPNGAIGGKWGASTGPIANFSISGNAGTYTGGATSGIIQNNGWKAAVGDHRQWVDISVPAGTGTAFVALCGGLGGTDNYFVKVQQNGVGTGFNTAGFYHGNNSSAWPITGGAAFFTLTTAFTSGRIRVTVGPDGDTITLDIDSNFDGIADESHSRGGLSSFKAAYGTRYGIGAFGPVNFDNWNAAPGTPEVCYPDCNGVGGLTIADFGCFQTRFVAGDPYADCNGVGGLTIADFGCFQTAFVAGCP